MQLQPFQSAASRLPCPEFLARQNLSMENNADIEEEEGTEAKLEEDVDE